MQPTPEEILADARWHLFDLRPEARKFTLLAVDEPLYRAASFLDQRITREAREGYQYPFERRDELFPPDAPGHPRPLLIFHVGHCGSTLLSRALAADDAVLPLREPLGLRALADARRALDHPWRLLAPGDWAAWLDTALRAHGRVFRQGQQVLVKATSTCNNLAAPALERAPGARAILLYVGLETYLAGMLKQDEMPSDLLGFATARMHDWLHIAGEAGFHLDALTRPQLAALAWLTSMRQLLDAAEAFPERTRLVDFDAFLATPEHTLAELAAFADFGELAPTLIARYPESAARYAKDPAQPYSAERRARVLRAVAERDREAIRTGLHWAEERARQAPAFGACLDAAAAGMRLT